MRALFCLEDPRRRALFWALAFDRMLRAEFCAKLKFFARLRLI
jgi:hypothetical protein